MKTLQRSKPEAIKEIEYAQLPVLFAPFYGTPVPVIIRKLTKIQIKSCGEISLIETLADKIQKERDIKKLREAIKYAEMMHKLVEVALVSPTYEQIKNVVGDKLNNQEIKNKLIELQKQSIVLKPTSAERIEIETEIQRLKIWIDLILPEDFLDYAVAYAIGINDTDIKKVNEKILLDAAIMGKRHHRPPHEYVCGDGGIFSDFNKDDIDARADYELYKFEKLQQKKGA